MPAHTHRGGREGGREAASKLDKTWKTVIRALPTADSVRSDGQRLQQRLDDDKADAADVNERFFRFRDGCCSILAKNLEYTVEVKLLDGVTRSIKLEDHLWDTHSHVNGWYRGQLEGLKNSKRRQRHVVEQRKTLKKFLEFVKSSQLHYRSHIARLASRGEGLPELKAIAEKVSLEALQDAKISDSRLGPKQRSAALTSCFNALIHLGDLSRWREQARPEGDANYSPAVGFYDLASALRPTSGRPHHQLAVIAASGSKPEDDLRVVYHFYLSLIAAEPHPKAEENLDQQFQKMMSRLTPQPPRSARRQQEDQATVTDLIAWHMQLHAMCRMNPNFEDYAAREKEILGYLRLNVIEVPMAGVLKKLVMVNLAAEWVAKSKIDKNPQCPVNVHLARFYFLKFNVRVMGALLGLLHSQLNDVEKGQQVLRSMPKPAEDKITPVMRKLLPSLVNYSSWLVMNAELFPSITGDGPFFDTFGTDVEEFWLVYAMALTRIMRNFEVKDLPDIDYLLDEDEETIGFKPFQDLRLRDRYVYNGTRKLSGSSTARFHPMKEMLGRLRRLVKDGTLISNMATTPLVLRVGPNNYAVFRLSFASKSSEASESASSSTPSPASEHPTGPSVASPAAPQTVPRKTSTASNPEWQQRAETMVDSLTVDPPAEEESETRFHEYPPRTRTPPAYSFEDPDFDINPFRNTHAHVAEAARRAAGDAERAAYAHRDGVARGDREEMEWMATEIGQAEEPVMPATNHGYTR